MKMIKEIEIQGLDCPDCAKVLEIDIANEVGVEEVFLDFMQSKLLVSGDFDFAKVTKRIQSLGFKVVDPRQTTYKDKSKRGFASLWVYFSKRNEMKLVLIGTVLLFLSLLIKSWEINSWVILGVQLAALSIAGYPVFRSAVKGFIINKSLNINFLMSVAAIGAVVIGESFEAVVMLILFAISEALEGFTNDKARAVLSEFAELAPKSALLVTPEGEKEISINDVQIGDVILTKSGDRFAMDGIVTSGFSDVNQAPITGESNLVSKGPGDEILSGTINGQGVLTHRVTRKSEDTTIRRIIQLVTEAQSAKADSQKFIDEFAKYYTPLIFILAILVAVIPPLVFGSPFWNIGIDRGWLYRALSLLVIGCPCALVISTPVTIISSLIRAARFGIVFKGGIFIEKLSKIKVYAFDKTGTLTKGKPVLAQIRALDCDGEETCEACNDMLALACSLEKRSNHPLRTAILKEGKNRGVIDLYAPAENLTVLNGKGLMGEVDGRVATIGSLSLFETDHVMPIKLKEMVLDAEQKGQTTMLICDGDAVRGFIGVADEIRSESSKVIVDLKHLGIHPIMLTGDNAKVASTVSSCLGNIEFKAHLLPEQKLSTIKALQQKYHKVVMVGDGINDSPALALSDVGVAMGGSTNAQVLETADIVLLGDDLHKLPFAIKLSKFTNRLIRQNIIFSLAIKFVIAIAALLGLTPLWVAVLADMGVSLLVTFNGMRVLRFKTNGFNN
ncbi:MAG: heavy metal translocating P-type ATPase [Anaerolineaceae bacterium]|nr:heavy metal translocating P-type ATPase [Anaerolineaceae bacterium]